MYKDLEDYIRETVSALPDIPEKRKDKLQSISEFIRRKKDSGNTGRLIFICTHNSRRSHFAQIWASVFAKYFKLGRVQFYSGGTEVTAFNPRAVGAITRVGFIVECGYGKNPVYELFFDNNAEPLICFSKVYDDPANPVEEFAAVMTCTDADENCPVIPGAEKRFSLPYRDPKESDDTSRETAIYDARCKQIAREMAYLISESIPDNS